MSETIAFRGDENIGIFTRVFEDVAFVPLGIADDYREALIERLGVEVVEVTIQGSAIIGSLLMGNNEGFVVSGLASPEEVAVLEQYREVLRLENTMNAAGNIILANDKVAVIHPDMPEKVGEKIADHLDVDVLLMTIGGIYTVGMAGVATNRGIILNPRASGHEIEVIAKYTDLPIGTGSVNMGGVLPGTGLLANSKGFIAGAATSGFELGRIDEVFGFVE